MPERTVGWSVTSCSESGVTTERLRPLLGAAGALAAGFLVLALGLAIAGYDASLALGALWRGAFGSWDALLSATMVRAVPLIVLGLGVALAFRAGALNIGGEGQFYAGAIAATWVGLHVAGWPAPLAVGGVWLAAAIAGGLWIAIRIFRRHVGCHRRDSRPARP